MMSTNNFVIKQGLVFAAFTATAAELGMEGEVSGLKMINKKVLNRISNISSNSSKKMSKRERFLKKKQNQNEPRECEKYDMISDKDRIVKPIAPEDIIDVGMLEDHQGATDFLLVLRFLSEFVGEWSPSWVDKYEKFVCDLTNDPIFHMYEGFKTDLPQINHERTSFSEKVKVWERLLTEKFTAFLEEYSSTLSKDYRKVLKKQVDILSELLRKFGNSPNEARQKKIETARAILYAKAETIVKTKSSTNDKDWIVEHVNHMIKSRKNDMIFLFEKNNLGQSKWVKFLKAIGLKAEKAGVFPIAYYLSDGIFGWIADMKKTGHLKAN